MNSKQKRLLSRKFYRMFGKTGTPIAGAFLLVSHPDFVPVELASVWGRWSVKKP